MKAPQNYIFVHVESEFNDEVEIDNGKKLFLTTQQFHENDDYDSSNFKPTMIRRHYGTVIGVPLRLTDEVKITQVDPGLPAPSAYIPNEHVQKLNKFADSWACLNSFVYQWKTCADFEMEVLEGDKVYFHHNTITEDNLAGTVDGKKVYKLDYQNAICVIRDTLNNMSVRNEDELKKSGDWLIEDRPDGFFPRLLSSHYNKSDGSLSFCRWIIPIAGHVLVEPLWQEGIQDLGDGKKGKVTKSGIIAELHEKPEFLQGRVAFAGSPFKGETQELHPGDKIFYLPHSDYEVEIEGKTYYVMKYWEIIAKFE